MCLPSDVLIKKRSQVELVAQVAFPSKQELVKSGKNVIFTPSPQVTERYNLLCANILGRINDEDKIFVKFVNVTNDSVILKAGTRVGTIEFIVDERPDNAEVTHDYSKKIGDRRRNNRYLRRPGNINCVQFKDDKVDAELDETATHVSTQNDFEKMLDKVNLSDDEISNKDKQNLLSLLQRHSDAFCKHKRDRGRTHLIEMTTDIGNTPLVISGLRRLSLPLREVVQKQIKELLKDSLIEPSTSEYSSPALAVQEKVQRQLVDL